MITLTPRNTTQNKSFNEIIKQTFCIRYRLSQTGISIFSFKYDVSYESMHSITPGCEIRKGFSNIGSMFEDYRKHNPNKLKPQQNETKTLCFRTQYHRIEVINERCANVSTEFFIKLTKSSEYSID